MPSGWRTCPACGVAPVKKNGRDRDGGQLYRGTHCGRTFTVPSGTPFAG